MTEEQKTDNQQGNGVLPISNRYICGVDYGDGKSQGTHFDMGVSFAEQWISVEDELPNNRERIICKDLDGIEFIAEYIDGSFWDSIEAKFFNITHWRPINKKMKDKIKRSK